MKWGKAAILIALAALMTFAVLLSAGCGEGTCDEEDRVTGSGEITQSNLSWELTSQEADKECHATFILDYGWSNADRAKNEADVDPALHTGKDVNECGVYYEFCTYWGVFPTVYGTKVVEGDKVFWRATLNIGAKNDASNPVYYRIRAVAVNRTSPLQNVPADYYDVWVDGEIVYTPY